MTLNDTCHKYALDNVMESLKNLTTSIKSSAKDLTFTEIWNDTVDINWMTPLGTKQI